MLDLHLKKVDVAGIYGTPPKLPERMRWLHPEAADSLDRVHRKLRGQLICSDVFRSMLVQRDARRTKKTGIQIPGYSGHNFGLSLDLDVDGTRKALNRTYTDLRLALEAEGWHCHRRDGAENKSEWWHFNYLGADAAECLGLTVLSVAGTWERAVERKIQKLYGAALKMGVAEAQRAFAELKLYAGAIDGDLGPKTRQAITRFGQEWDIPPSPTGPELSERVQRTLAMVTARRKEAA